MTRWVESYALLPKFMTTVMHYNPGTRVHIQAEQTISDNTFKWCWWAFKPAHAHPVINIDATFEIKVEGKIVDSYGM